LNSWKGFKREPQVRIAVNLALEPAKTLWEGDGEAGGKKTKQQRGKGEGKRELHPLIQKGASFSNENKEN